MRTSKRVIELKKTLLGMGGSRIAGDRMEVDLYEELALPGWVKMIGHDRGGDVRLAKSVYGFKTKGEAMANAQRVLAMMSYRRNLETRKVFKAGTKRSGGQVYRATVEQGESMKGSRPLNDTEEQY